MILPCLRPRGAFLILQNPTNGKVKKRSISLNNNRLGKGVSRETWRVLGAEKFRSASLSRKVNIVL